MTGVPASKRFQYPATCRALRWLSAPPDRVGFVGVYRCYPLFHPKREGVVSGRSIGYVGQQADQRPQTGHTAGQSLCVHANVRRFYPVYTAKIEFIGVYRGFGLNSLLHFIF